MTIPIAIWSDIACPWCFVGKANLDAAINSLRDSDPALDFEIHWRAFELDPTPREPSTQPYQQRLAKKLQRSVAEVKEMVVSMTAAIRAAGGDADFDKVIAANTFDAHRLIQWAGDCDRQGEIQGAQHRLVAAMKKGYLAEGLNLADHEQMLDVVESVGLERDVAADVLKTGQYGDIVRADEELAQQHGIRGVPFFVIGRYGLSGAQPSATLVEAIQQVVADEQAAGNA